MFFNRKKKRESELDAAFQKVYEEIRGIDDWDNPKKLEHYILDSCEQIISATKEIEAQKTEYRIITDYLKDIQTIQNLPEKQLNELRKCAKNIEDLTKSRENFLHKPSIISDDQFLIMEENEEILPMTISRMQENERYQSSIEKDMQYLEAEKSRYEIEYNELSGAKKWFRLLSLLSLGVFGAFLLILFFLKNQVYMDFSIIIMAVFLVGATIAMLLMLGMNHNQKSKRRTIRKLNDTIGLLNVERMKYANVTRAIRYEQDRYHVQNSHELNYVWECYINTVESQMQFDADNSDLEYFLKLYIRLLENIELYDRKIWLKQVRALIHPEDMQNVNHNLVERRAKVRARIQENTKAVKSERDEIDHLMKEHNYYVPEIMQIISSVDKLCGLNA
ncbi:MAG: hypothetical protein K6A05_02885 [Lachnospiraceae bacterium]|nr:hypothetical protein [Lachnospiraceae bacterium]